MINNCRSLNWQEYLKRYSKSFLTTEAKDNLIELITIETSQSDLKSKIKGLLIKMWWAQWVPRIQQAFWITIEATVSWLLHQQLSQNTSRIELKVITLRRETWLWMWAIRSLLHRPRLWVKTAKTRASLGRLILNSKLIKTSTENA